jgi:4-aminobutyrate aminotransferase-like enzyme
LFLPWTVQEREDPVLEFERGEGVYFFDRQGRRYLDFLSQRSTATSATATGG